MSPCGSLTHLDTSSLIKDYTILGVSTGAR